MKVVTAQEMRDIDRITIKEYGIPGLVLMARAGLAVASRVRELYPEKKTTVICGGGNNGGDGLVAARELFNRGFKVNVLMFAKKNSLSPDCNAQYQIARKTGVPIEFRKTLKGSDLHGAVIIDAVFGTGLSRHVEGNIAGVFAHLNKSGAPVISVDIPSGISSDTGEILGDAVRADCTVTFGLPKRGHFLYPGADYTGRLFVEDIGFPWNLINSDELRLESLDGETVSRLLPARQKDSHKGDYGHVLVVAGSKGKTGAALMAANACLRSGAGLVTLAAPESLADIFQSRATEEMIIPLPDDGSGMLAFEAADEILKFAFERADVIAVGPGIGVSVDTGKIISELVLKSTIPLVIDADGINSLGGESRILRKAKSPVILTPHPGEMARLLKVTEYGRRDIAKDRINAALSFSKQTGAYLILKGAPTIIASPEGNAFINTTGNPGMATAGSGDVLTGIIASLLGQGINPLEASVSGVFIHGLAGDIAAQKTGEHSLIASDIIRHLPDAFIQLLDNSKAS